MEQSILLRAKNLYAGYPESGKPAKKPKDILQNISFKVGTGERLCIVGPNGCGKTTLLRVCAGILPYKGELTVTIQDPFSPRFTTEVARSSLSPREAGRECGLLTQLVGSPWPYTVEQTVQLGRYARQKRFNLGISTKADIEAINESMEICGVMDLAKRSIAELSGGQLQRVFLARTIAQEPSVLLLDEPTNHLDLRFQIELLDYINAWVGKKKRAVIGVFHDLSLALRFADTMLLLDSGTVAAYGQAKKVVHGEEINKVYGMDVAKTMRTLLQNW